MRILVTGAAGFIGSHVAEAALAAGDEVRGLDSLAPAVHDGRPGYWPDTAELVNGDIRDPAAVARAVGSDDSEARGGEAVAERQHDIGLIV